MLTNQYTAFGNDMMSKYAGMVSAINPLSLFYLKNAKEEESSIIPQTTQITYVQNQIHKVNHHHYHTMANRYMINYQNTMNLIASNPVYEQSPNFKRDIMPANLVHAKPQKSEEETKEETKEIVRSLVKQVVSEYKETLVRETTSQTQIRNFLSVLSETPVLLQHILPMLEREVHNVWIRHEKETEKEIVREMTKVLSETMEKAAQKLPDQYRKMLASSKGQNLRMQTEETVSINEVKWLAENVTRRLTREVVEKRLAAATGKIENAGSKLQFTAPQVPEQRAASYKTMQITSNVPAAVVHPTIQIKQRIGKERFQTQVMGRIAPLPVRPVSYVFPKEKPEEQEVNNENKETAILQKVNYVIRKETAAEYKYYTHILEKFLKKDEDAQVLSIDKRELPAGIIWHQKPKETVRFERKEILQVPMSLVYDRPVEKENTVEHVNQTIQPVLVQAQTVKAAYNEFSDYQTRQLVRRNVPDFTNTTKLVSVFQNSDTDHELTLKNNTHSFSYTWKEGMLELVLPKAVAAEKEGTSNAALLQRMVVAPVQKQLSAYGAGSASMQHPVMMSPEEVFPQTSQTLTAQQNIQSMQHVIRNIQQSTGNIQQNIGNIQQNIGNIRQSSGTAQQSTRGSHPQALEVAQVTPVVGSQAPGIAFVLPDAISMAGPAPAVPAAAQTVRTAAGQSVGQMNHPVQPAQNTQPAIAPAALVYKSENVQTTQQQEIKKIEEKTEFLEDIVFEKKIVTKDTRYKYDTTNETHQGTQTISQTPESSPMVNGTTVVSRAEVDGIVSESVSRHVDENISKISKQVYKDIERQLKKERERRGLK